MERVRCSRWNDLGVHDGATRAHLTRSREPTATGRDRAPTLLHAPRAGGLRLRFTLWKQALSDPFLGHHHEAPSKARPCRTTPSASAVTRAGNGGNTRNRTTPEVAGSPAPKARAPKSLSRVSRIRSS